VQGYSQEVEEEEDATGEEEKEETPETIQVAPALSMLMLIILLVCCFSVSLFYFLGLLKKTTETASPYPFFTILLSPTFSAFSKQR